MFPAFIIFSIASTTADTANFAADSTHSETTGAGDTRDSFVVVSIPTILVTLNFALVGYLKRTAVYVHIRITRQTEALDVLEAEKQARYS